MHISFFAKRLHVCVFLCGSVADELGLHEANIVRCRLVCQENRRHNIWFFGYSVTCGLVNDAKVGESGLLTD